MYNCFFNADSFIVFSTQRRGGAETQHLLEKTETLQLTFGGAQRRKRHGLCFAEFAEIFIQAGQRLMHNSLATNSHLHRRPLRPPNHSPA